MDWDLGISRCKLLYIEQINKVLLGNCIQYPLISHTGKKYEKECMCVYTHMRKKKKECMCVYTHMRKEKKNVCVCTCICMYVQHSAQLCLPL